MEMPRNRPIHLRHELNRHGNYVWYFRKGNGKRTRIDEKYGTKEFNEKYEALLAGKPIPGKEKEAVGTIAWMIDQYRNSGAFKELAASTRRQRETYLRQMELAIGKEQYKGFKRADMQASVDKRRSRPSDANKFIKAMKHLFKWAEVALNHEVNPTNGITKVKDKTDGFPPWEPEHVQQFREYWAISTKERMVMEMFLWWGLRVSDMVRLGKQHFKNGIGGITAQKNDVFIPLSMTDYLQHVIDNTPTGDLTFIITEYGRPRSVKGLGMWFSRAASSAGLQGLSAHGLRKTAATLLAEASGTESELKAAFGWTSNYESSRYTKKAKRKKLGLSAAQKRLNAAPFDPVRHEIGKDK